MAYRYFASRTIYQIVAAMEMIFSAVILIFSSIALKEFLEEDETFRADNQILLYSSIGGIVVGLVQIAGSIALILCYRDRGGPRGQPFDKDDLSTSKVPTVWFFLAFVTFAVLLFVVTGPLVHLEVKRDLVRTSTLKNSMTQLFTYVVANALFKILFIWAVSTTIKFRRRTGTESTLGLER